MNKGKITKLKAYTSGKGYFIGINNAPNDFMFFGSLGPEIKIGSEIEYEEGKPTKDHPTIKTLKHAPIEAFIDEDKPRSAPVFRQHDAPKTDNREAYWAGKEKRDLEREPVITRLSCLSSASMVYEGAQGSDEKIIALAARFERFAKGEKV